MNLLIFISFDEVFILKYYEGITDGVGFSLNL